jgi:hypothetical protein
MGVDTRLVLTSFQDGHLLKRYLGGYRAEVLRALSPAQPLRREIRSRRSRGAGAVR